MTAKPYSQQIRAKPFIIKKLSYKKAILLDRYCLFVYWFIAFISNCSFLPPSSCIELLNIKEEPLQFFYDVKSIFFEHTPILS